MAAVAIGTVAFLHAVFLVMEMFLWTKPIGRRSFGLTEELAAATATLARNQGLYNGFLAAGLVWAALSGNWTVRLFFLACVIIAGFFGGLTVGKSILCIQAAPGLAALILAFIARPGSRDTEAPGIRVRAVSTVRPPHDRNGRLRWHC